jgi:hypothetical protein
MQPSVYPNGILEVAHRVAPSAEKLGQAAQEAVDRAVTADAAPGRRGPAPVGLQTLIEGGGVGGLVDQDSSRRSKGCLTIAASAITGAICSRARSV